MSLFALFYMIFAYLLGSISSAILICKVAGLPDPRKNGSNNLRYFKRDVTGLGRVLFRAHAI